jgi:hypothetical protein
MQKFEAIGAIATPALISEIAPSPKLVYWRALAAPLLPESNAACEPINEMPENEADML